MFFLLLFLDPEMERSPFPALSGGCLARGGPAGLPPGESPSSGLPGHTHTFLLWLPTPSQLGTPMGTGCMTHRGAQTTFSSTDSELGGGK